MKTLNVRECGCDLDGDVFYYRTANGEMVEVYINLLQEWHNGWTARTKAMIDTLSEEISEPKN